MTITRSNRSTMLGAAFRRSPFLMIGYFVVLLALSSIPVINTVSHLLHTGMENPSNDEIPQLTTVDAILSGGYAWQNFFRDTFYQRSHALVFPVLGMIAFQSSQTVEMMIGVLLTFLRAILYFDAFTHKGRCWWHWLMLIPVMLLTFNAPQISSLEIGMLALVNSFWTLGIALGIWACVRLPNTWTAVILMLAGGLLASWSFGAGVTSWGVFIAGMLLMRFRRPAHYAAIFIGMAVAALPYATFIFIVPTAGSYQTIEWFNLNEIALALGWAFIPGYLSWSSAAPPIDPIRVLIIGSLGLLLTSLTGVFLLLRRTKELIRRSAPGLLLMLVTLAVAWQVSWNRDAFGYWYTVYFTPFWIGLVGVLFALWTTPPRRRRSSPIFRAYSVAVAAVLLVFFLSARYSLDYYSVQENARLPVSSSCVRYYQAAPEICGFYLYADRFGVNPEDAVMVGAVMDRHQLSTHAPFQRWTLQGDWVFETVQLEEASATAPIFWMRDGVEQAWDDRHYGDLVLYAPNAITWTVTFPPTTQSAEFISSITAVNQDDSARLEVINTSGEQIILLDTAVQAGSELPVRIALNAFIGQTITLRLTSTRVGIIWQFPHIDVIGEAAPLGYPPPALGENDLVLNQWAVSDMQADAGDPTRFSAWGDEPTFDYALPLAVVAGDYSHLYLRLSAASPPDDVRFRHLRLSFQINGAEWITRTLVLWADEATYDYFYPIKLLPSALHRHGQITGLRVLIYHDLPENSAWLILDDVRLIRANPAP